jgi:hypothetical protein
LYSSLHVIGVIILRRVRCRYHVVYMGDVRNELRLFGNSEVKRPLERPDSTWKDTIKMDFKELECEVLD